MKKLSYVIFAFVMLPGLVSAAGYTEVKNFSGDTVEINISELDLGDVIRTKWKGMPIYITKRSPIQIEWIKRNSSREYESGREELVRFAERLFGKENIHDIEDINKRLRNNKYRSLRKDIFVSINVSDSSGCAIIYEYESTDPKQFMDPCRDIIFDITGRYVSGINNGDKVDMLIPPHHFKSRNVLVIGEMASNKSLKNGTREELRAP